MSTVRPDSLTTPQRRDPLGAAQGGVGSGMGAVNAPSGIGADTATRRPAYAVDSVDHALMTLELLANRPSVRLTELAVTLDIGRATAHRLLQMMVYRGFAVQNPDRSYAAGPALSRVRPDDVDNLHHIRSWFRPKLEELGLALGETVHLTVLVGIEAVFLDGLEGAKPLHVEQSRGARCPAEYVAAGLVLLATLSRTELRRRYAGRPPESMAGLERVLLSTRRRGFGLMLDEGRDGVASVAALVRDARGQAIAAVSCSAPTLRFRRPQLVETAGLLNAVAVRPPS